METWDRVVFEAGGEAVTWRQVADHARARGTWTELERTTAAGVTALRRARDTGSLPSPELVGAAEAEFRYARRLVAADDLLEWLAARVITVGQWREWILRELCRTSSQEATDEVERSPDDLADSLWVSGWCSDAFHRMAQEFAGRVAARLRLTQGGAELSLDDAFDRFRADVITEEAVRAAVGSNYLEWITFDSEWASFADEDAAREGLACLRDGLTMDDLADMGAAVATRRFAVDDIPPDDRQVFLSATEGDYLGPLAVDGTFAAVAIRAKVLPSVSDEEVRSRAAAFVLSRAIERAVDERVRWVELL